MYSHHSKHNSNTATTPKFRLNDTLVEVDGWRLVRPLYPELLECKSYMVHMECKSHTYVTSQSVNRGVGKVCGFCGETPPDEIVALEILHNGKI